MTFDVSASAKAVLLRDSAGAWIVTAAEMRAAEDAVIATGVSANVLMERAGAIIAEAVWRFGAGLPVLILCGPGNNGGDGYVVARLLSARGIRVHVAATGEPVTTIAKAARALWTGGVSTLADAKAAPVLIDALFGTGLTRPLSPDVSNHLGVLAARARYVIAVDVPSGVGTDDGALLGCAAQADITIALGALKPAHVLRPSSGCCGQIFVGDIGVGVSSSTQSLDWRYGDLCPKIDGHKYDRALVVVAGEMAGAAQLCAEAGSHLSGYTVLVRETPMLNRQASIVERNFVAIMADQRFKTYIIGPGLGADDAALLALIASDHDLVIDADALTLIAKIGIDTLRNRKGRTILTPHAGEFERLFGKGSGSKIDRARSAASTSGSTIIFKGPDTMIASPSGAVTVNPAASPWLGTAGTGDVLAGIAGALLTQMPSTHDAACAAVWLHSEAARRAGPAMIAEDIIKHLQPAIGSRA